MKATIPQIREVRARTGLGLNEVVKAFCAVDKAEDVYEQLAKQGVAVTQRRQERTTAIGRLQSYVHHNGRYGSLCEFRCETDFVANSEAFQEFMHNIAMHVAVADSCADILTQEYIKDPSKKIGDLLSEITAKTGEKVEISYTVRRVINDFFEEVRTSTDACTV